MTMPAPSRPPWQQRRLRFWWWTVIALALVSTAVGLLLRPRG
jgi:hypothetical protein